MNAEIVSTGTELLLGKTLNTSVYYLTQQLTGLGIEVNYHTTVGDNRERLTKTLELAFSRSDLILITGGLGPTADDITKDTVAQVLNAKMIFDYKSMESIENYYPKKSNLPSGSEKQAFFPEGSRVVPNLKGTAPGAIIRKNNKYLVILPGPPSEMKPMFEQYVLPELQKLLKTASRLFVRTLKVFGLGESELENELEDLLQKSSPFLTLLDKHTYMDLRMTVRSNKENSANQLLSETEREIRRRLGTRVFAVDEETHAGVVGKMLREKNLTLATAESCSGGLLGGILTNEAGSSDYYLGGVVSYANSVKENLLGVKPESLQEFGAVSDTVAREMAEGVRNVLGADISLATTGIAGPGGGTEEKPVGLVYIALASRDGVNVQRCRFVGNRESIRNMTVETALNILRLYLLNMND